ncbi:element excision factor XisI family protein [Leptolyngbya sp. Heron Island J]|nr:element excision factor XisI family protein [Leptolyngbya sp. Heron Island J]
MGGWVDEIAAKFLPRVLVNKGIAKTDIVLRFQAPEIREYTDYATA